MYDVRPVLITARSPPPVWGGGGGVTREFLLGLCGLNPDPISDQKIYFSTPVFRNRLLIPVTFFWVRFSVQGVLGFLGGPGSERRPQRKIANRRIHILRIQWFVLFWILLSTNKFSICTCIRCQQIVPQCYCIPSLSELSLLRY